MDGIGRGVALDRPEDGERLAEVLEKQLVAVALVEEHVHDARTDWVGCNL